MLHPSLAMPSVYWKLEQNVAGHAAASCILIIFNNVAYSVLELLSNGFITWEGTNL
jgi:hypothetical protein